MLIWGNLAAYLSDHRLATSGSKQTFVALVVNDCDADFAAIRIFTPKDRSQPEADLQNPTLQFSCCGQVRPRTAKVSASLATEL